MSKTRRRILFPLASLLLLTGLWLIAAHIDFTGPPELMVSRETTYITEPLNPDGTVNYAEYLDRRMRKGVTKDNNALVLLVRAFGRDFLPPETGKQMCERLGIEYPDKGEAPFTCLEDFVGSLPEEKLSLLEMPEDNRARVDELKVRVSRIEGLEGGRPFPMRQAKKKEYEEEGAYLKRVSFERRCKQARQGPWSREEFPLVAEWIETNHHALRMVVRASKRAKCYIPVVPAGEPPSLYEAQIAAIEQLRECARALVARALWRVEQGDLVAAQSDLSAVHLLARRTAESWTMIGWLVGQAMEETACKGDLAYAVRGGLTREAAISHLAAIDALGPFPDLADEPLLGERLRVLDMVMSIIRGEQDLLAKEGFVRDEEEPPPLPLVNWNTILRKVNSWQDRLESVLREDDHTRRRAEAEAFSRDFDAWHAEAMKEFEDINRVWAAVKGYFLPRSAVRKKVTRAFAVMIMSLAAPSIGRVRDLQYDAAARRELARCALALQAYKAEQGFYPERLDRLVPSIVPAVPEDPWSRRPLVYEKTEDGYLLYSVGVNLKDDGGEKAEERHKGDIVVRVPRRGSDEADQPSPSCSAGETGR